MTTHADHRIWQDVYRTKIRPLWRCAPETDRHRWCADRCRSGVGGLGAASQAL